MHVANFREIHSYSTGYFSVIETETHIKQQQQQQEKQQQQQQK